MHKSTVTLPRGTKPVCCIHRVGPRVTETIETSFIIIRWGSQNFCRWSAFDFQSFGSLIKKLNWYIYICIFTQIEKHQTERDISIFYQWHCINHRYESIYTKVFPLEIGLQPNGHPRHLEKDSTNRIKLAGGDRSSGLYSKDITVFYRRSNDASTALEYALAKGGVCPQTQPRDVQRTNPISLSLSLYVCETWPVWTNGIRRLKFPIASAAVLV